MFVVTGLHTKRRPHIDTDKSSVPIRQQRIGRPTRSSAVSYSHRRLRPAKFSPLASSLVQATVRISGARMTQNDSQRDSRNEGRKGICLPIRVPPGRISPTRVRKFIPKPLILVERMKTRQLLLESPLSVASESCVISGSLTHPKMLMVAPHSAHVTPQTHWMPTSSTFSSGSHSSSDVSVRVSLRNKAVFRTGFEMMPRVVRPLSVVTLGDSSWSTDTLVADSPCCVKQCPSKVPLLVTATDVMHVHLDECDPRNKRLTYTGVPVLVDSVTADFVHQTCQSADSFEPTRTSTPFAPGHTNTLGVVTSTVYPTHAPEQTPGLSDSIDIVSPTSRAVYPFNPSKGAYIVRLPNLGSTTSGNPPMTFANAPKPTLDFKLPANRGASKSPRLVLDGVFALPQPSPSPSSSLPIPRVLNGFPQLRKPTLRRPLSNKSNALTISSPPQSLSTTPTSSRRRSGFESPRSRLARVLTGQAQPQTVVRKQACVPPLVTGIQASNDPKTQCEIEGLRMRRVVELGRGSTNGDDVDGNDNTRDRGIEQVSLVSVGRVAQLRARWEVGPETTGNALQASQRFIRDT